MHPKTRRVKKFKYWSQSDWNSSPYGFGEITLSDDEDESDVYEKYGDLGMYGEIVYEDEIIPDDEAMTTNTSEEAPGGIDMNAIDIERQGEGITLPVDPVMMENIRLNGVDGFTPVIINLIPINSVMPLLGLAPVEDETEDEETAQLAMSVMDRRTEN